MQESSLELVPFSRQDKSFSAFSPMRIRSVLLRFDCLEDICLFMKNSLRWLISITHGSRLNTFRLRKSAKEYAVCSYLEYTALACRDFFPQRDYSLAGWQKERRIITIKSSFFFPHQAPTKTAFSSLASLPLVNCFPI